MKVLIVAASRYGSTTQGARWIAERLELERVDVDLHQAQDAPPPDAADLVILGSGLYAHRLLPSLNEYIDLHVEALRQRKVALFALAMRTTPIFARGHSHGGLAQLEYLFKTLEPAVVHADVLGGEMVYNRLSAEDAAMLDRFYAMLELTPQEIGQRKAPRTFMNKADYWAFAEVTLRHMG
jgi:menaquinone-dependent protoporphyrinogen oxidase